MPAKDELLLPEWAREILNLRDEAERLSRLTASVTLSSTTTRASKEVVH